MRSRGKASDKVFLKTMKGKFQADTPSSGPVMGVYESAPQAADPENRRIAQMLSDIVTRLERIEEKIDESVYPPEAAMKPAFVKSAKKAQADIKKGKGKTYDSIDDLFGEIEA